MSTGGNIRNSGPKVKDKIDFCSRVYDVNLRFILVLYRADGGTCTTTFSPFSNHTLPSSSAHCFVGVTE